MTIPNPATGLVDLLFHPPLSLVSTALDNFGPYQGGSHELRNFGWASPVITPRPVSQTVGVIAQLNGTIPPGWGFTSGWVSNDGQSDESSYEPALAQLVTQHQLTNGLWVTTQRVLIDRFPVMIMWEIALPGRIGLLVAPRLAFDLIYLIVA